MVSKVFEHPFDLTKVRLQSQVLDATARFDGPIDCLAQDLAEGRRTRAVSVRGTRYTFQPRADHLGV